MGSVGALTGAEFGLDDPDGCDTLATALTTSEATIAAGPAGLIFVAGKTYSPSQMTIKFRQEGPGYSGDLSTGNECLDRAIPFIVRKTPLGDITAKYFGQVMTFSGSSTNYLLEEFAHIASPLSITP